MVQGSGQMGELSARRRRRRRRRHLDPARPEKTRRGVWGGRSPPSGFGFRDPARRPGPGPPAIPGPGPPAIPGITRPGSNKGYGLGLGLGFGIG